MYIVPFLFALVDYELWEAGFISNTSVEWRYHSPPPYARTGQHCTALHGVLPKSVRRSPVVAIHDNLVIPWHETGWTVVATEGAPSPAFLKPYAQKRFELPH